MKTEQGFLMPKREEVVDETYSFVNLKFDILLAWEYLMANPRLPEEIDVKAWSAGLSYLKIDGKKVYKNPSEVEAKSYSLNVGTGIDWKYAREMDAGRAEIPGIMVSWGADKLEGAILIDGNHRLANHLLSGKEQMKVYLLTDQEFKDLYPDNYKALAHG